MATKSSKASESPEKPQKPALDVSSAAPKHRKVAEERKEELIRVRVTLEQKTLLTAAAERAGLDVSSWLRSIGLREASRSEGALL